MLERIKDPKTRAKIKTEMAVDHKVWENLYFECGGGAGVLLSGVQNPELKKFNGKTVAEVAKAQGKSELDALMDFVIADNGQTGARYFMASEQDSLDGPLYEEHNHPRAFGSMPRFLGKYVRDQKLMPLEQAIRKITSMPAQREHLHSRGMLQVGYFADVTIFDADKIIDRATYTDSNKLSEGVDYVIVNGKLAYDHGTLTGANSGRALRGPGWTGDAAK